MSRRVPVIAHKADRDDGNAREQRTHQVASSGTRGRSAAPRRHATARAHYVLRSLATIGPSAHLERDRLADTGLTPSLGNAEMWTKTSS